MTSRTKSFVRLTLFVAVSRNLPSAEQKSAFWTKAAAIRAHLMALEQEKTEAETRLRNSKPGPVLRLHTKLPELYRSKVERLAEELNAPGTVAEASEIMRGLIDRIVLTPEGGPPSRAARRSCGAGMLRRSKRTQG
jgi:hypothetical protein